MRSLQSITLLIVAAVVSLGFADEPLIEPPITDSDRGHWAFEPLRRPMPPVVQNANWCRTAIDRFILARLEEAGLVGQVFNLPGHGNGQVENLPHDVTSLDSARRVSPGRSPSDRRAAP